MNSASREVTANTSVTTEYGTWSLFMEGGTQFRGRPFGYAAAATGEVVFNTGMVGYPEALTDPSYRGQILVLTFPLVGNYGVSQADPGSDENSGELGTYESNRIQVSGLVVSEHSTLHSHRTSVQSLSEWLRQQRVPGLFGVDTRAVTRHIREHGTLLGGISSGPIPDVIPDPNLDNLVSQVSIREPRVYAAGSKRIVLVDCGCKSSIIREFTGRGVTVVRVPWDYDFLSMSFDGVVISNGPGDPKQCGRTVENIRKAMDAGYPILGICLGHQLLSLAAGANTFKMKFGHRGQNQPCNQMGTKRCFITSQNHGYAVDSTTLPEGWIPWFTNANDGSNEGLRHQTKPFMSVQFHPEAAPGPTDAAYLFDDFIELL